MSEAAADDHDGPNGTSLLPADPTPQGAGGCPGPRFAKMGTEKFSFYDEVRILDTGAAQRSGTSGRVGPVVGLAENSETGEVFYTVYLDELGEAVTFAADSLKGTGRVVDRSEIYDGTSLRVSVEGHVLGVAEAPTQAPPTK